jgi:signal transduction histidine kinase
MAISEAQPAVRIADRSPPAAWRTRLAVAGALVCAGSVALAAAGATPDAAFGRALLQLLIVGVPIATGLYALRAPATASFGVAMLGIGFAWSVTALTESTLSVPYTIGRISTWLVFPCVVYLLLAFPHGRIAAGLDRVIFFGALGVMLFLFFGTAPLVEAFPPKTLWATCTTDCPANALFVLDEQPAFLATLIRVREWLVELIWLGLFYSMYCRWRAASPLQQRAMGPAFVAGGAIGVVHIAHITARQRGAPADAVIALSEVWTFCIVAVCAGFLLGLLWRRMLLAGALARLGGALLASDDRAAVRNALATALGDSTLQLLYRDPDAGTWRAASGRSAVWPHEPGPGRALTPIGGHDVALIHDVALLDDPELLDGVSGMVLAGWRHERLTADLSRAMSDLEDSRRRIAEAADVERARIERDLHDGAQQRLVALRIRLGLAVELLKADPAAGLREIDELGFEVERAHEELRSLAHGVYPALLTDRGLVDALRAVAVQAPMPVRVVGSGVTRHRVEIESAVYFTCVEALQNALKHAPGSTRVSIKLSQTRAALRFEVGDDGPGFTPDGNGGRGLRNMRDRIEAIGGTLTFDSQPGAGTRVTGRVGLS